MTATTVDRRLLCQCDKQPDSHGCDYPATAEDMLCDLCRKGCVTWCWLVNEDAALHLAADAVIDWDYLDGDVP